MPGKERLMNNLTTNRASRITFLFIFSLISLFGCQSTSVEEVMSNCQTQSTENCSVEDDNGDNGDDRGYNPCLVNKNLPVCKK